MHMGEWGCLGGRAADSWSKGPGFESRQERRENFLSRVNFLCRLLLRCPFHHRATAAARKRSRPGHSAKSAGGRLQLNTCTSYVCGFKESDTINWCMVVWSIQNLRRDGSSFMWHQPYGFCGRKARLNHAHALVTVCPKYVNPTSEDIKLHIIIISCQIFSI